MNIMLAWTLCKLNRDSREKFHFLRVYVRESMRSMRGKERESKVEKKLREKFLVAMRYGYGTRGAIAA